jgi:hypothetical protein
MAVGTNTYFSNAIPGMVNVGADIDIFETNLNPKWAVGTGFSRQDGNRYRYVQSTAGAAVGLIVSQDISETNNASTDALVTAPVVTYQMADEPNGTYPGALGSRYVIYTLAAVTKNQFAGGYFVVGGDTGYGYIYRIKGNTATDNPASGKIRIELYDKIQVALDATSDTGIVGSIYNDVRACTAGTDFVAVGATVSAIAATYFGWIQTHGVACVLQSDTCTGGDIVTLSATVAGAYQTMGVGTTSVAAAVGQQILGYSLQVPAAGTTGYGTIYLQLE